jgi:membrane-bound lytic murein transglycosylase MltF
MKRALLALLLLAGFAAAGPGALAQESKASSGSEPAWVKNLRERTWTGDFDGMVQRGRIRVLVVFSKTYYFIDKGIQHGLSYDTFRAFEDELKKQLKLKKRRLHVLFVPVRRDQLIPALLEGRGDIAAAGLTITPERQTRVDFTDPVLSPVEEIVVTGPQSPEVATLDDLAGQQIYVRRSSSYYEHLEGLNAKLQAAGKKPIRLRLASEDLEDEDLLEMLNAGLVNFLVIDRPIADFWARVLPSVKPRPDLVVNSGGAFAWMIRKGSPQLAAALNAFIKRHGANDPLRGELLRKYLKSTKFVKNATSDAEMRKFQAEVALFKKYGTQYSADYLLMMAQGYQESRLDQNVKSPVGAIGVMQVMPSTGKAMKVGDVTQLDPNINAGVKFLTLMRDEYFGKEPMDELNKTLFAFAAYNAGPGRIRGLRKLAEQRGFDPNVWFNNVEVVASEKVGMETVTYVGNVFKYYIAYKLVAEREEERRKAKESTRP